MVEGLIKKVPKNRIKLEEILRHKFFTKNKIPINLPFSFIIHPPSREFIKEYNPNQKFDDDFDLKSAFLPKTREGVILPQLKVPINKMLEISSVLKGEEPKVSSRGEPKVSSRGEPKVSSRGQVS